MKACWQENEKDVLKESGPVNDHSLQKYLLLTSKVIPSLKKADKSEMYLGLSQI